tara:strand:- start:467 stop:1297 length:831 start_codon:yes stop_codon:yes gene_type:complete
VRKLFLLFFIICISYSESNRKIITIGGSVTEIVFELGLGDEVIAVDQSSVSPSIVTELPQVGYIRMISAEGILSLNPNIILTTTDIGPPKVIDQLKQSGVEFYIYDSAYSLEGIISLIKNISNDLKINNKGLELINEVNNIDRKIEKLKNNKKSQPKMVFFMNPSIGSFTAAGASTKADYFIKYLGGDNVFSNQFKKYSKVTKENIVNLNPDIILAGSTKGGNEEDILSTFYNKDEFKSLNAIKNKDVIYLNMGKYLTFGSNFTKNVYELLNQMQN